MKLRLLLSLLPAALVTITAEGTKTNTTEIHECWRGKMHLDLPGNDIGSASATSIQDCQRQCHGIKACRAYTYTMDDGQCYFKSAAGMAVFNPRATSGVESLSYHGVCLSQYVYIANCDLNGFDEYHEPAADYHDCNTAGRGFSFTWSQYQGGTCWVKSLSTQCKYASGLYSGVYLVAN